VIKDEEDSKKKVEVKSPRKGKKKDVNEIIEKSVKKKRFAEDEENQKIKDKELEDKIDNAP
jgi:hypothetical protein